MRFLNILILIALMLATAVIGNSQTEDHKFEVGVQTSSLRGSEHLGVGIRLGYNINQYLGVEGETNFFGGSGYPYRQKVQAQFGVKTGIRFNKFGIFGKVRPGFINTKQPTYFYYPPCPEACILVSGVLPLQNTIPRTLIYPSPIFVPLGGNKTHFSLDVGGVVEFNPTKRFFVRADIGDTIAKRDNYYFSGVTHNLQITTGVGIRF